LEERLAQRKAKLAEMKKSQEEELSKNDPEKQEILAKEQVDLSEILLPMDSVFASYVLSLI
jgi:hypothetical protein